MDFAAASATAVSWTAVAATQTDYFVTIPDSDAVGSDAANQVMHGYVDAVGHVPVLPEYAAGYWHRYVYEIFSSIVSSIFSLYSV